MYVGIIEPSNKRSLPLIHYNQCVYKSRKISLPLPLSHSLTLSDGNENLCTALSFSPLTLYPLISLSHSPVFDACVALHPPLKPIFARANRRHCCRNSQQNTGMRRIRKGCLFVVDLPPPKR